ncbi:MAG: hypothetical protein RL026_23 [Pseudomonadota bacterium]|jgi:AbrB family looped-hinge helix DNA binding protein
MPTAKLTSKGQITLPKEVRETLGVYSGDRVEFVASGAGYLLRPATQDLRSLRGILAPPAQPVSIDDMNEAIGAMGELP